MIDVRQVWWIFEADRLTMELEDGAAVEIAAPNPKQDETEKEVEC